MNDASLDLRAAMPLLAANEGIWEGVYRHYDAEGRLIDEHQSRLVCRILDSGPVPYHQSNHYTWADGRTDVREFRAGFANGRLVFDNVLISGWAAEVALDDHRRTMMLNWVRKGEPETYLYEMIQTSDDRRSRARVWQWLRAGKTHMRTLIDEHLVSRSWAGH
jgi:hypothetical protein